MPIALEKIEKTSARPVYVEFAEPPDDPSGTVLFTRHGFFEIPKAKHQPTHFIPKKTYVMESYYFDVFSKLPFAKNFTKRKLLAKWLAIARSSSFQRKRETFSQHFWAGRPVFARHLPFLRNELFKIQRIIGVEVRESVVYGLRHTEFSYRQSVCIEESMKKLDVGMQAVMGALQAQTEELQQIQDSEKESHIEKQVKERVTGKRDEFIGIDPEKRGKHMTFEKIKALEDRLKDAFFWYVRIALAQGTVESLENTYTTVQETLTGPKKPRFELIMAIKDELTTDPDMAKQKNQVTSATQHFYTAVLSNQAFSALQAFIETQFQTPPKIPFGVYIDQTLEIRGTSKKCQTLIEKQVESDCASSKKFIGTFKHLEAIKKLGESWVDALSDKQFDVVHFYKENYQEFNNFNAKIEEIPISNTVSGVISIETNILRSKLLDIPKGVISALKERLQDILTKDSHELKTELFGHQSVLEEKATNLPQFVQQLNATNQLKEFKIQSCQTRLNFVLDCLNLCRKEALRIPSNVYATIDECKSIMKSLPIKINEADKHYIAFKQQFEEQMHRGSEKLSRKIIAFEEKFCQRYLEQPERLDNTPETLKELEKREDALVAMKQRVELFESYNKALDALRVNEETPLLLCRQHFDSLFALYCDTLKLWKLVSYWQNHLENWLNAVFARLNVLKMYAKVEKISSRLKPSYFESKMFTTAAARILEVLNSQIEDFMSISSTIKSLKNDALKPRHWEQILKIIKKPHYINTPFKLQDLKDSKLPRYVAKLQQVLEEAEEESKHEIALVEIKRTWESAELTTEKYRGRSDTFVLTSPEKIDELIEENITTIQTVEQVVSTEHILAELDDWKNKLGQMKKVHSLWVDCQNAWLQLEPIFNSKYMQETLPEEYAAFIQIHGNLRRIMWTASQNPRAAYNLMTINRDEMLKNMLSEIQKLRRNFKAFLESRRQKFPRFYFLSDPQLLDFISSVHSQRCFDQHISTLFPAVAKFFTQPTDTTHHLPVDHLFDLVDTPDIPIVDSGERGNAPLVDAVNNVQIRMLEGYPFDILGMIGHNDELLVFDSAVNIHESIEEWIREAEKAMQHSLQKLLPQAMAEFSYSNVDEWALDFPLQISLTCLALVVTSEMNELLQDRGSKRKHSDASSLDDSDNLQVEDFEEHFTKAFSIGEEKETSKIQLLQMLQHKSFKGLNLRIHFWINQIVQCLKCDYDNRLTGMHSMVLKTLVHNLCYHRDTVNHLIERKIVSTKEFDWQKLVKTWWTNSAAKISCGPLELMQGCEYFGNNMRIFSTPLTAKCFLFMSCSIMEGSPVLLRTCLHHDLGEDVYSEFASICGMGHKRLLLNQNSDLQGLMQYLNGAALSKMWMFFEHLDRLPMAKMQALTREIQMIQQQFLISEPSQLAIEYGPKSMFVVMASLTPTQSEGSDLIKNLRCSFRTYSLGKPSVLHIASTFLQREGFKFYSILGKSTQDLSKLVSSRADRPLGVTYRDIEVLICLARQIKETITESEIEIAENLAMVKACKLYFLTKLKGQEDVESGLDDWIFNAFKRRSRDTFEVAGLKKSIEKTIRSSNLSLNTYQVQQCENLYISLRMFRGVLLTGQKDSGKSTIVNILKNALSQEYGLTVGSFHINPSIFTFEELFGSLDTQKTVKQGLLTALCAKIKEDSSLYKWLVLSPHTVQEWWAECLLPLLDTNPMLSAETITLNPSELSISQQKILGSMKDSNTALPNMINLEFPEDVQLVIETSDASVLSPSFTGRLAVIHLDPEELRWESLTEKLFKTTKYLKYGVSGGILKQLFMENFKSLVDAIDEAFTDQPMWNLKCLVLNMIDILRNILDFELIPSLQELGHEEGLVDPSEKELSDYIKVYAESSAKIIESKERLKVAMLNAIVWAFGSVLPTSEKARLNLLIRQNRKKIKGKYMFPKEINIYDFYFDWNSLAYVELGGFESEYVIPSDTNILVSTPELSQVHYLAKIILKQSLAHLCLIGESGSGKTSMTIHLTNSSSFFKVSPHLTFSALHNTVLQGEFPAFVVIEDLHLDYGRNFVEDLEFWIKNSGFHSTLTNEFTNVEEVSFITTAYPSSMIRSSTQSYLLLETPASSIFKSVLVNQIYMFHMNIDGLMSRYLKITVSILINMWKAFPGDPIWTFARVRGCFEKLLYFTTNCEYIEEKNLPEERRIAEIIAYEISRSFKDGMLDKKAFDEKITEELTKKFKISVSNDYFYGDYLDPMTLKYNQAIMYRRRDEEDFDAIQTTFYQKAIPMGQQEYVISLFSEILNPPTFKSVWAFCRAVHAEKTHTIVDAPPGEGGYESLQLACLAKKVRIIEPDVEPYGSPEKFQESLENCMLEVLRRIMEGDREWVRAVFLFNTEYLKDPEYLDILNRCITAEETDVSMYTHPMVEELVKIETERIHRLSLAVREKDPLMSGFRLCRKYTHVIIFTKDYQELEQIAKKYPRMANLSEFSSSNEKRGYTQIQHMIDRVLDLHNDTDMCELLTEVSMYIKGALEKDNIPSPFDLSLPIPGHLMLTSKRLIILIETFQFIYHSRAESIEERKQLLEGRLSQTQNFKTLHTKMHEKMTSLQNFTMKANTKISELRASILSGKESQEHRRKIIADKKQKVVKKEIELKELEEENQKLIDQKDKTIKRKFEVIFNYLTKTRYLEEIVNSQHEYAMKMLEFMQEIIMNSRLELLREALERPEYFLGVLESSHFGPFSIDFTSNLSSFFGSVTRNMLKDPFVEALYDYLEAVLSRALLLRILKTKFDRADSLKKSLQYNDSSISYSEQLIQELEQQLTHFHKQEKWFLTQIKDRKEDLKVSEITHIRTDTLLNAVEDLHAAITSKLELIQQDQDNLLGDSVILSCICVFLNTLPFAQRMEICSSLCLILQSSEIPYSECWVSEDTEVLLGFYRRAIKSLGLPVPLSSMDELQQAEAMLFHHYTRDLGLITDETGEMAEFLQAYTQAESLKCSYSGISVQEAYSRERDLILQDFTAPVPDAELETWKIGPGLCSDHFFLNRLWQKNLKLCNHVVLLKKTTIIATTQNLHLLGAYGGACIYSKIAGLNPEKVSEEVRIILVKTLLPDLFGNFMNNLETQRNAYTHYRQLVRKRKADLLDCNMDNIQDYEHYRDLVDLVNACEKAKQVLDNAQAVLMHFYDQNPLLVTYAEHIIKLFLALKHTSRRFNDTSYSWKLFKQITEVVASNSFKEGQEYGPTLYSQTFMLSLWGVLAGSLPQQSVKYLAMAYALVIAESNGSTEDVEEVKEAFSGSEETMTPEVKDFIYTHLGSVFSYTEDLMTLHEFIKTGSWRIPLGLFAVPGLNVVNNLCSIGNLYGIELEVIRTNPIDEETEQSILESAEKGSWVLISTAKFPTFLEELIEKISDKETHSNFKLFIDMQGFKHYEVPESFLHRESVRFYVSGVNLEDLGDSKNVWGRLLREDKSE